MANFAGERRRRTWASSPGSTGRRVALGQFAETPPKASIALKGWRSPPVGWSASAVAIDRRSTRRMAVSLRPTRSTRSRSRRSPVSLLEGKTAVEALKAQLLETGKATAALRRGCTGRAAVGVTTGDAGTSPTRSEWLGLDVNEFSETRADSTADLEAWAEAMVADGRKVSDVVGVDSARSRLRPTRPRHEGSDDQPEVCNTEVDDSRSASADKTNDHARRRRPRRHPRHQAARQWVGLGEALQEEADAAAEADAAEKAHAEQMEELLERSATLYEPQQDRLGNNRDMIDVALRPRRRARINTKLAEGETHDEALATHDLGKEYIDAADAFARGAGRSRQHQGVDRPAGRGARTTSSQRSTRLTVAQVSRRLHHRLATPTTVAHEDERRPPACLGRSAATPAAVLCATPPTGPAPVINKTIVYRAGPHRRPRSARQHLPGPQRGEDERVRPWKPSLADATGLTRGVGGALVTPVVPAVDAPRRRPSGRSDT